MDLLTHPCRRGTQGELDLRRFDVSSWKILCLVGIPALMTGCATVRKDFDEYAMGRVLFEMKCPKEQIQVTGLNISLDQKYMALGTGAQVGVSGCGQSAVYVRTYSGWVLNSEMKSNPEAPAQAAAPQSPKM